MQLFNKNHGSAGVMELETTNPPHHEGGLKVVSPSMEVVNFIKKEESHHEGCFEDVLEKVEFKTVSVKPKIEDSNEEPAYDYHGSMRHLTDPEPDWDSPEFIEKMDLFDENFRNKESASYPQRIKKPLNAFMLFMKQMRPILKDKLHFTMVSSDANKLLGKLWRQLSEKERASYIEMAALEKHLHRQQYPEYDAKLNYARSKERRKHKWKRLPFDGSKPIARRCRAIHGTVNLHLWCKGCTKKKKCLLSNDAEKEKPLDSREEANLMLEIRKCQSMYGLKKFDRWCTGCKEKKKCLNTAELKGAAVKNYAPESDHSEGEEKKIKSYDIKEPSASFLSGELKTLKERAEERLLANQDLLLTKINRLLEKQEGNYSDQEKSASPKGSDGEQESEMINPGQSPSKCKMETEPPRGSKHIGEEISTIPQTNIIEELRKVNFLEAKISETDAMDIGVLSHRLLKAGDTCDDLERCCKESCDAFVLQDLIVKVYTLYLKTKENATEMSSVKKKPPKKELTF